MAGVLGRVEVTAPRVDGFTSKHGENHETFRVCRLERKAARWQGHRFDGEPCAGQLRTACAGVCAIGATVLTGKRPPLGGELFAVCWLRWRRRSCRPISSRPVSIFYRFSTVPLRPGSMRAQTKMGKLLTLGCFAHTRLCSLTSESACHTGGRRGMTYAPSMTGWLGSSTA